MVTDVNLIYCGDHLPIYTNIESISCAPETNVAYHTSIFKNNNNFIFRKM